MTSKNVYGGLRHSCGVAHCGGGHGGAAHGSAGDVHETGKRHCGKRNVFFNLLLWNAVILICGSNSILQKQIFPEYFPQDTVHLGMMKRF
jgi:hypothetical protein